MGYFLRSRKKRKRIPEQFQRNKKICPLEYSETSDPKSPTRTQSSENISLFAPEDANWDQWVSATQTRNYLHKDPLIDWIEYNYSPFVTKNPKYTKKILSAVSGRKKHNFTEFIMAQGNSFESAVIQLLCKKFGTDVVKSIGGELAPHSPEKVQETIDAMNIGIPFIHSGLLHNPSNQTYGIPDLLVRSDWIKNLVNISPIERKASKIKAPKLKTLSGKPPGYHYRVVDIKFTTLNLRSDGKHILNSKSFPAYKSQLWIYNEALGRIQGYTPPEVYILGRRWNFTSKGECFNGPSCFDKLGVINYETVDKNYPALTEKAIEWVKEVHTEDSRSWNILNVPLEREELYPNMSNSHDYPWHSIKKEIANSIGEITSLWMMGPKNRKRAHEEGVFQWTNPDCTTDILGVNGEYTRNILSKILKINQPRKKRRLLKIEPKTIYNNDYGWKTPQTIEFYVDFETVSDILTDFGDLPEIKTSSMIFMIGVGYVNPLSNKWHYRNFVVDSLLLEEEARICEEFSKFIRDEAKIYGVKIPLCVHWAPAEYRHWENAVQNHSGSDKWKSLKWQWFDLLEVFKQEPIVIEGCLNFGLKSVASAMKKHNFIKTIWDGRSSCLDGKSAMVGAWNAHQEAKNRGISMRDTPEMREIGKYNEVDVKVLQEILLHLRKYHI